MKKYRVSLVSVEFGEEVFSYNTKKEAEAAKKRLEKSAKKQYAKDGILRTVYPVYRGNLSLDNEPIFD